MRLFLYDCLSRLRPGYPNLFPSGWFAWLTPEGHLGVRCS